MIGRTRKGFTTVEILLSLTLLSILLVVSAVLLGRGLDAFSLISSHTDAVEQARYGLVRMERELELVRVIQTTQPDRLGFIDALGNATDFRVVGTDLMRGNDPLARNVNSLAFTYYASDGTPTPSPSQTRRIRVELGIVAPAGAGSITLRTEVFPRNFTYDTYQ